MKKQTLQPSVENLLAFIQPDLNAKPSQYATVLEPFVERGLATPEQVALLSKTEYKRTADLLNTLSRTSYNRPAALRTAAVRLEGQRGRPKKLYILTEEGVSVLRTLFAAPDLRAPQVTESVELIAAYAIMEVYTQARLEGYIAHVEQPLYFANGKNNVRADVVIETDHQTLIFEIEQMSNQGTLPRAVDKVARLHNFYLSSPDRKASNQVRMLFNLPQNDEQTILTWRQALRDVMDEAGGPLSFQLYAQRLNEFLESPDWEGFQGFEHIEPAAASLVVPKSSTSAPAHERSGLLAIHSVNQVDELRAVMRARDRVYGEQMRLVQQRTNHELRVQAFFEIVMLIYTASHYRCSPVETYAALPTESWEMLSRYLHDEQNKGLLEDLQYTLEWIHSHNTGIMSLRNGFTAMVWDVFLFYHGLGRGGPLIVNVRFPELGERRSDVCVEVDIDREMEKYLVLHTSIWLRDKKVEEVALAWILQSMILYPHMIGLGEKPWLVKPGKTFGKKKKGDRHE